MFKIVPTIAYIPGKTFYFKFQLPINVRMNGLPKNYYQIRTVSKMEAVMGYRIIFFRHVSTLTV